MSLDPTPTPGADDFVARLKLVELMIAEGRQATCRFGWIFVLWGLVNLGGVAFGWMYPHYNWTWPITISAGIVLQVIGLYLRRRIRGFCTVNTQTRALSAIWATMCIALVLYCFTAIFSHHAWGSGYSAAIFVIIGIAHAASAVILRWPVQAAVAVFWWAGGLACFFLPGGQWFLMILGIEMLFGMVLFGIYAMILDRNTPPPTVVIHA